MLAARKHAMQNANNMLQDKIKSHLPTGHPPGAPGKNPEYRRLTFHEMECAARVGRQ
tara:strand:+ start:264 stop:434 length:171 start_codon:yes stop_codon:yes gene_type:complete